MQFPGKSNSFFHSFFNLFSIQASNTIIQLLLFPVVIHFIGLESFGYVAVANSYAGLLALFMNYGTNLSGIKEVAVLKGDKQALAAVFFNTLRVRILLFICSGIIPVILYLCNYIHLPYLLFATPIIFAEVINPIFFFNGIEKLLIYNIANLFAKLVSAALIIAFIRNDTNPALVNFYLGIGSVFFYILLIGYVVRKHQLPKVPFSFASMYTIIKKNFFLVCNNLTGHLQQSFFLFLLSFTAGPIVLGAYSLCDKVIWSFRILIVSFANAIYPRAAVSYLSNRELWLQYKKKMNVILAISLLCAAAALLLGSELVVYIFTGQHDALAASYIRTICIVPFLAGMNSLNIIEFLIKSKYRHLFYSSMTSLVATTTLAFLFVWLTASKFYGWYAVSIEAASVVITLYFLRKEDKAPITQQTIA
jgi:O-antigen/teichoic acid export membrane protein